MDIRKQFAGFSKGGRRIVPVLRLEGSLDHYCFSPEGRMVLWREETREAEPIDLTFTALMLKEIQTLQERAKKIQNEPNPYAEFGDNPKTARLTERQCALGGVAFVVSHGEQQKPNFTIESSDPDDRLQKWGFDEPPPKNGANAYLFDAG